MPVLLPLPPQPTPAPPAALRPRQIEVLLVLSRTKGPLTRGDIAERWFVKHRSTVSHALRPLIERGLVKEEHKVSDSVTPRLLSPRPRDRELAAA